jgi:thiol:disulfide interchange protein DsbD
VKRYLFLFFFTVSFSFSLSATPHTHVELVSDKTQVKPGDSFLIALHFKIDHGWHIYWKNPGDSGMPIRIQESTPTGFITAEWQWPVPQILSQPPLTDYGYQDELFLIQEVKAISTDDKTSAEFSMQVSWLECKEECLPGKASLSLNMLTGGQSKDSNRKAILQGAQKKIPLKKSNPLVFSLEGTSLKLDLSEFRSQDVREAYFFPHDKDTITHNAKQNLQLGSPYPVLVLALSPSFQNNFIGKLLLLFFCL